MATPDMCYHCFDVLIDSLQNNNRHNNTNKRSNTVASVPAFAKALPDGSVECPLFVTWDKQKNNNNYQLRGCIGTLSPRLLAVSVGEYALISALQDRRFTPVQWSELTGLRVSVSLLVQYEECEDSDMPVYDWTIGVHGILIAFTVRGQKYNATYLPEVAKEQGWDHKTTLHSLIQKAGYQGPITPALLKKIQCTRYQSSKCQVTFADYVLHNCQGNDPLHQHSNTRASTSSSSPPPSSSSSSSSWTPCNNL
jgi:uncharacterized protein (TIGR00296 family)